MSTLMLTPTMLLSTIALHIVSQTTKPILYLMTTLLLMSLQYPFMVLVDHPLLQVLVLFYGNFVMIPIIFILSKYQTLPTYQRVPFAYAVHRHCLAMCSLTLMLMVLPLPPMELVQSLFSIIKNTVGPSFILHCPVFQSLVAVQEHLPSDSILMALLLLCMEPPWWHLHTHLSSTTHQMNLP